MLIVSLVEFNEATKLPVIFPITNGASSPAAWGSPCP